MINKIKYIDVVSCAVFVFTLSACEPPVNEKHNKVNQTTITDNTIIVVKEIPSKQSFEKLNISKVKDKIVDLDEVLKKKDKPASTKFNPDEWKSLNTDQERIDWYSNVVFDKRIDVEDARKYLQDNENIVIASIAYRYGGIIEARKKNFENAINQFEKSEAIILDGRKYNELSKDEIKTLIDNCSGRRIIACMSHDIENEVFFANKSINIAEEYGLESFSLYQNYSWALRRNSEYDESLKQLEKALEYAKVDWQKDKAEREIQNIKEGKPAGGESSY